MFDWSCKAAMYPRVRPTQASNKSSVEATIEDAAKLTDVVYPEHNDSYTATYTTRYEMSCKEVNSRNPRIRLRLESTNCRARTGLPGTGLSGKDRSPGDRSLRQELVPERGFPLCPNGRLSGTGLPDLGPVPHCENAQRGLSSSNSSLAAAASCCCSSSNTSSCWNTSNQQQQLLEQQPAAAGAAASSMCSCWSCSISSSYSSHQQPSAATSCSSHQQLAQQQQHAQHSSSSSSKQQQLQQLSLAAVSSSSSQPAAAALPAVSLPRRERLGTVGRALLRASSSASDELIGGLPLDVCILERMRAVPV
uniref:Uncharacterized protein n=1 Tax=Ananas comosus var. bracteatus TaxID=296719 RepID=A0A6V7QHJ7_ANACO|nr:unnamed protein product [Ananas comosus var. bracteatus]